MQVAPSQQSASLPQVAPDGRHSAGGGGVQEKVSSGPSSQRSEQHSALVAQPVVNAARSVAEATRADLSRAGSETGHAWTEAARANYLEAARLADARHQKV